VGLLGACATGEGRQETEVGGTQEKFESAQSGVISTAMVRLLRFREK